MPNMNEQTQRPQLRLVRNTMAPRVVARLNLERPGALDALHEVAADWLFEQCGDEGRRKLLREHDLLAA